MASRSRPEMMGFRLTAAERKEVELAAAEAGTETVAAFIRDVVLTAARVQLCARVMRDAPPAVAQ